jgi:predicted GNAT family N-acyltransferase
VTERYSKGITHLKDPSACTKEEHRKFERLVRLGFEGSDERLPERIRSARRLAFYCTSDDVVTAIAALKAPDAAYRNDVFRKAEVGADPREYELELGWVFVVPAQRGNRIAEGLCHQLLASVPTSSVFATTRPNNAFMTKILSALGFRQAGRPYLRNKQELVVFLRS